MSFNITHRLWKINLMKLIFEWGQQKAMLLPGKIKLFSIVFLVSNYFRILGLCNEDSIFLRFYLYLTNFPNHFLLPEMLFPFLLFLTYERKSMVIKQPHWCHSFLFFLGIFYWICYYGCSIPTPSPSALHLPSTSIPPCLVHVHGSYMYVLWLLRVLYYS